MKIAILILLIYSIFGIHITCTLGHINNIPITTGTDRLCTLIAIILYCIMVFQTNTRSSSPGRGAFTH